MQNKQTLIDLGFERNPDWDWHEIGTEHYQLKNDKGLFRAYEVTWNGSPVYCMLGKVTKEKGIVDYWRDCQSEGSILKHITNETK